MDICGLSRKLVQLHAEVGAMKSALKLQVDQREDLCVIITDVNGQVCCLGCAESGS